MASQFDISQGQQGDGLEGLTLSAIEELKKAMTEARERVKNRGRGGFPVYVGKDILWRRGFR
ncbi:hypothetical protein OLMES_4966 [Oleiphilus messinensis]|uniref:Uncharacterized protein n=1 Tax=Oleiphilus messinensis TaxID=141451 RepID=A0A1Y0IHQ4_9GAMM|nr:hypothetical protein [Oleiphilus messinensis]ARU58953.1 hypothetical protein OLMES_4966 [Oleiphilus messinensis]